MRKLFRSLITQKLIIAQKEDWNRLKNYWNHKEARCKGATWEKISWFVLCIRWDLEGDLHCKLVKFWIRPCTVSSWSNWRKQSPSFGQQEAKLVSSGLALTTHNISDSSAAPRTWLEGCSVSTLSSAPCTKWLPPAPVYGKWFGWQRIGLKGRENHLY